MKKQIKITINLLGLPKFEGIGFQGSECHTAMQPLLGVFGGRQTQQDKPEMQEIAPEMREEQNLSL